MSDLADYELQKDSESGYRSPSTGPSRLLWISALVLLIAAVTAGYWYLHRTGTPGSAATAPAPPAPSAATSAPPASLGAETTPIELPPLDASDAVVRDLVRALSSHPVVLAWLTTDGVVRNAAVVVENIASGATPARHLRGLKPSAPFRVRDAGGPPTIDPADYARYDRIAAAASSIDAGGAARLYSTLKPRLEEAYRDLGHDGSFDRAVESAIVALLQVPAVDGDVALALHGALYRFDDPRLEQLTPAQKQLLRMGPRNVRIIQQKLREVALALGIPAERLPAA